MPNTEQDLLDQKPSTKSNPLVVDNAPPSDASTATGDDKVAENNESDSSATPNQPKDVFTLMSLAQQKIAEKGVGKDDYNQMQKFNYRSIDAVYNVVSPIMASVGLLLLTTIEDVTYQQYQTKSGGDQFEASVWLRCTFISTHDGSKYITRQLGVARDTGDKASVKAYSMAMKYVLVHHFLIPTVGEDDPDAENPALEENVKQVFQKSWLQRAYARLDSGEVDVSYFVETFAVPDDLLKLLEARAAKRAEAESKPTSNDADETSKDDAAPTDDDVL